MDYQVTQCLKTSIHAHLNCYLLKKNNLCNTITFYFLLINYLHVSIHVPCSVLPAVSHFACKCNIWKQKYHSIPERPPLLFISNFYFTQSLQDLPPPQDAPKHWQSSWIIIAQQAVQLLKYSSKDYWMSEVTAAESQKITEAGRDLSRDHSWSHDMIKVGLTGELKVGLTGPGWSESYSVKFWGSVRVKSTDLWAPCSNIWLL